ncbi:hypothetical protein BSKO_12929 [Bryopsis sp. KO-2023]|nr:hypothetical protein BSKO_12929 [Bryopsis sp. KO-2023]
MERRTSNTGLLWLFVSAVATMFVARRLWEYSRQVEHLESQLQKSTDMQWQLVKKLKVAAEQPVAPVEETKAPEPELVYHNVHPKIGAQIPELQGSRLEDDAINTVEADDESTDDSPNPILGQFDGIEDGYVTGWACQRGVVDAQIKVGIFVDGVHVGDVRAKNPAPHSLTNRICAGPPTLENGTVVATNVAFRFKLPTLPDNVYQVRGFAYQPDGLLRKELHLSPVKFIESREQPGMVDAMRRKDDIIRARNAQIASLYEQVHTKGAWESATKVPRVRSFKETQEEKVGKKMLVFIGVNSDPGDKHHRTYLRNTWVPTGEKLKDLEEKRGVMIRFIVGKSDWLDEKVMSDLRQEMEEHGDIMPVDIRGFEDAPKKVLGYLRGVSLSVDADFFFKVEKDVVLNLDQLVAFLEPKRNKGNLYLGCMKSGEVVTSSRKRWNEPDHWRFGDPIGKDKKLSYHRHAHGQVYGLSGLVARYLAQNADVMHGFAHDDVTLGAWLLGLEVEYVDEAKLCCDDRKCLEQKNEDMCIAFFESSCPGICKPESRVPFFYQRCVKKFQ